MRRFYKEVSIEKNGGAKNGDSHAILLDGKPVKTPSRRALSLPNAALANSVKAEWDAQGEKIDPASMVMTGFANAAIDRVADERAVFVQNIAAYGETDLFCYRADSPDPLIERQMTEWQPWLDWAHEKYDAPLFCVAGIMHKKQAEQSLKNLRKPVLVMNDFQLSAMAKMTHISGSLVASLAIFEGDANVDDIWPALCLDELWQEEQWGADDFAEKHRNDRYADFSAAVDFLELL